VKSKFSIISFFGFILAFKRGNSLTHAKEVYFVHLTSDFSSDTSNALHQGQVALYEFILSGAVHIPHTLNYSIRTLATSSDENNVRSIRVLGRVSRYGGGNTRTNA
jgi:hypothetical protein